MDRTLMVGADVGGTNVKYLLVDPDGQRYAQGDIRTDPQDPQATMAALADAVGEARDGVEGDLVAVGLACAGIVDSERGWLGRSPNLPGWQDHDLIGGLQSEFPDVRVAVANDVNAAAWGEFRFGAGREDRHVVVLALGTGVGGGVVVDGRLVTGHAFGAGEIGHITLDLEGPPCPCGNLGCLESYCGSVGLLRRARELGGADDATDAFVNLLRSRGTDLTVRDLGEVAAGGDDTARRLFTEAGRRLGQAAANLVNILAPDRVIVGGGVAQAGDLLLAPCRAMVRRHVMAEAGRDTPVVVAELGPFAAAMGAAALAAETGDGS